MLQWKTIVIYKSHQLYQQEARETDMDDVRTALKHDRNQVKSFFALDEKITYFSSDLRVGCIQRVRSDLF